MNDGMAFARAFASAKPNGNIAAMPWKSIYINVAVMQAQKRSDVAMGNAGGNNAQPLAKSHLKWPMLANARAPAGGTCVTPNAQHQNGILTVQVRHLRNALSRQHRISHHQRVIDMNVSIADEAKSP